MRTFIHLVEAMDSTKNELEARFGNEANYPMHYDTDCEDDDPDCDKGPMQLGNYGDAVICTSWRDFVVDVLPGRAKPVGFWCEDNHAPGMERLAEGHDFALVDGRYIVDGWLKNIEGETNRAVFDLQDPADAEIIKHYYGDPVNWEYQ